MNGPRLFEAVRSFIINGIDGPGVYDELHAAFYEERDAARADAPPVEPGCPECGPVGAHNPRCASQWNVPPSPVAGLREALHQKADLLQRDDSRDYSHQVVRLTDVHEIIDEALPGPREPGTYRTPEGGVEVIVGIEESASYVEDQWPDEVAFLIRAALLDEPVPPEGETETCPTCWQPVPVPQRGDHDYGIPLRAEPVPLDVERLAVAIALVENHTMQDVRAGIAGPQTRAQAARYAAAYEAEAARLTDPKGATE